MAEITTPELEPIEPIQDTDLGEVYQPNSGGERRDKKASMAQKRTYFQGTLPTDIQTINDNISDLKDGLDSFSAISIFNNRTATKEILSGTLTTSGWYKIAQTSVLTDFNAALAEFYAIYGVGSLSCKVSHVTQSSGGNFGKIELTSYSGIRGATSQVRGFRIGTGTGANQGAIIEVYVDTTVNSGLVYGFYGASSRELSSGWELLGLSGVTDNLLPDAATTATYYEAGSEYSFNISNSEIPIFFRIGTADILRCSIQWPEIPKQGTSIALTLPSTDLKITDGAGTVVSLTGGHSTSNFEVDGKFIYFNINQVAAFGTLNFGPLVGFINGTGCKLTITG